MEAETELTAEQEDTILEAGQERYYTRKEREKQSLKLCENCKQYKENVMLYIDIAGDPNDKDLDLCESCAIELGIS